MPGGPHFLVLANRFASVKRLPDCLALCLTLCDPAESPNFRPLALKGL